MKITEDKADRDRLFARLTEERFVVRAKGYEATPRVGWPRKHQLWPCVRLGAGAAWLARKGQRGGHSDTRRRSLNFLRGHSHEALMTEGQSLIFIYEGVGNEVDEWTGDPAAPFTEIKSTALSSARMWPIVQAGDVDILSVIGETPFHGYFIQSCQNSVATGVDRCRLRIFFMNGDYGARRKSCPACKSKLGELHDAYRECPKCHYKSYSIDLRSYILEFTEREMTYFRQEVFHKRRDQYHAAMRARSMKGLLEVADASPSFLCKMCDVGQKLGCDKYGGN